MLIRTKTPRLRKSVVIHPTPPVTHLIWNLRWLANKPLFLNRALQHRWRPRNPRRSNHQESRAAITTSTWSHQPVSPWNNLSCLSRQIKNSKDIGPKLRRRRMDNQHALRLSVYSLQYSRLEALAKPGASHRRATGTQVSLSATTSLCLEATDIKCPSTTCSFWTWSQNLRTRVFNDYGKLKQHTTK